jgi:hypothetical protein
VQNLSINEFSYKDIMMSMCDFNEHCDKTLMANIKILNYLPSSLKEININIKHIDSCVNNLPNKIKILKIKDTLKYKVPNIAILFHEKSIYFTKHQNIKNIKNEIKEIKAIINKKTSQIFIKLSHEISETINHDNNDNLIKTCSLILQKNNNKLSFIENEYHHIRFKDYMSTIKICKYNVYKNIKSERSSDLVCTHTALGKIISNEVIWKTISTNIIYIIHRYDYYFVSFNKCLILFESKIKHFASFIDKIINFEEN